MPPELTSETDLASQILVIVGQKADARLPSFTAEELFNQASRKQLLDCAQTLGLTGVSKLVKEDLAISQAAKEKSFKEILGPGRAADEDELDALVDRLRTEHHEKRSRKRK